jgi:hypothetical protein
MNDFAATGRRPDSWITPCKPERSSGAARGRDNAFSLPELRSSSTRYGVVETWHAASLPRAALRLHGVIHLQGLRPVATKPL